VVVGMLSVGWAFGNAGLPLLVFETSAHFPRSSHWLQTRTSALCRGRTKPLALALPELLSPYATYQ
jgi:hypothetical protein